MVYQPATQCLYLAKPASELTADKLTGLGFTEFEGNVWAIVPDGMTKEQCQEQISTHPRSLILVEESSIVSLEEGLTWLES